MSVSAIWKLALKLSKPPQAKTLQRVHCGSAPLSAHAWNDIRTWTGTRQVCNAYGITETGSWVAGLSDADCDAEDGLIGEGWGAIIKVLKTSDATLPLSPADECQPGESGFVWLNTPALMKGYFQRDDLTRLAVSDGWFLTGDIGAIDERGRLVLRGRERDEINERRRLSSTSPRWTSRTAFSLTGMHAYGAATSTASSWTRSSGSTSAAPRR